MESATNIRFDIEYDGTDFAGWARQPGLPTVEGSLQEALGRILQQEVQLCVAGRTDAGVHARGQVASALLSSSLDPGKLRRSANQLLPEGIVITRVSEAAAGFDARRDAISRTYSYTVLNRPFPSAFASRFTCYHPGRLDIQLLRDAAALMAGRHDFTAFTPTVTEHAFFEREITMSEWRVEGDILVYWIRSSSFLRGMVRAVTGTMLEIGRGYRPLEDMAALLKGATRPEAGKTAPPQGLFLEAVEYKSDRGGVV